ncbi:hypothetical protein P175DRAFT_0497732 [Aspergillus ochraceoroseus IBT 24754]|uniref:MYND-type domain-containing protein n=1 Tax=Aspergillus ochraceoroseus IBT 24754 TaxID=1392256 RepID=A0A2T5M7X5_9EURO|nr:uncharacterized protein P175DRAFT_0497732 [Aspergillus ochraceoroseus IBT 24754]PTU24616.1 hypothetical protein P175DRAFT_0497732 [Aspergillus ochraceoroseus IBT 24754]
MSVFANLRTNPHFPCLNSLPGELSISAAPMREYAERPWCFLGEITQATIVRFFSVELSVRDSDGAGLTVIFACHDEPPQKNLQPGRAILILNPYKRPLGGGKIGIAVNDLGHFKVLPFGMQALFELNDRVQTFCSPIHGKRPCHGCGTRKRIINKCQQCLFFWYCNRECQEQAKRHLGHRDDCAVLQDPDMRALFRLQWGELDEFKCLLLNAQEKRL